MASSKNKQTIKRVLYHLHKLYRLEHTVVREGFAVYLFNRILYEIKTNYMGMMKEFKEFAMKGNLVDIAVAFVMGASFGKIVTSFVDGIVMPLVGMLTGGVNFNDKVLVLKDAIPEVKDAAGKVVTPAVAEVAVKYGAFITNVFDFIIVAFSVFLVIKAINKMKKEAPAAPAKPAEPTAAEKLLAEIRDSLKKVD
jgi:large conductance mechanosensitive channel